ncbi:putative ATP-dependent chaperone [Trypanosoma theileri]|uniref:Putative ATP-dependent chaperone n=1 Tax=Trypanosoma theileri TaxID=67003 RepID=A0A1X0P1R2_9TRYP|nr:putative ATP-dependent chaperone [Trypanosoma theileri]ORC90340.1 putative ATP-dependent chaperone [Trypanosoma theileri]
MRRHSTRVVALLLPVPSGRNPILNSGHSFTLPDPQALLTSPTGLFAALSGRNVVTGNNINDNGSDNVQSRRDGRRGRRRRKFSGNENSNGKEGGDTKVESGSSKRAFFNPEAVSLAVMILILTAIWEAFSAQKENLGKKIKEALFITLEVRSSREEYAMIMNWMGRQPQGKRSRNISLMPISVKEETLIEEGGHREEIEIENEFVPGFGDHYIKYKGTRLWITRSIDTSKQYRSSSRMDREDEILQLVFFTRDRSIVRNFMDDVRTSWEEQSRNSVRLYLPSGWGNRWEFLAKRLPRTLSTLYLPDSTMSIVEEARVFLRSKSLYMSLGVPWRRGYLFEGPPGTGKTSFILALASEFSLPIYLLSLQSKELDDAALIGLINSVPPKSLLVIEDLETAIKASPTTTTNSSTPTASSEALSSTTTSSNSRAVVNTEVGGGRDSGVSLSALLNAIDGIASSEGRVLVITTNDASRLPSPNALLRPGRIDRRVFFGPLEPDAMKNMMKSFQSISEDGVFKATLSIPEKDTAKEIPRTPAELQNELLSAIYKNSQ